MKYGGRADISAYLILDGAKISAAEQKKPIINLTELEQYTHELEPILAKRVINVDKYGRFYDETNPYPITFDGTINIGEVEVKGTNGNFIEPNPDGSINVKLENGGGGSTTPVTVSYSESSSVPSGSPYTLLSYTVPVGNTGYIQRVICSGENIARYDVQVAGVTQGTLRTYFGGPLDTTFDFGATNGAGVQVNGGQLVTVIVTQSRPYTADFEASLEILLETTSSSGQSITASYQEVAAVSPNVPTNIGRYVVPVGNKAALQRILVSGENVARYDVTINSASVATKRTYFGGSLNAVFEFSGPNGEGISLNSGDVVIVQTTNSRPYSATFESTIEIIVT